MNASTSQLYHLCMFACLTAANTIYRRICRCTFATLLASVGTTMATVGLAQPADLHLRHHGLALLRRSNAASVSTASHGTHQSIVVPL